MPCRMNKKDDRMFNLQTQYTKKCRCGCSVVIYPWENVESKVCRWCGRLVYMSDEKQKKHNFITDMQKKLKGGLNGRN